MEVLQSIFLFFSFFGHFLAIADPNGSLLTNLVWTNFSKNKLCDQPLILPKYEIATHNYLALTLKMLYKSTTNVIIYQNTLIILLSNNTTAKCLVFKVCLLATLCLISSPNRHPRQKSTTSSSPLTCTSSFPRRRSTAPAQRWRRGPRDAKGFNRVRKCCGSFCGEPGRSKSFRVLLAWPTEVHSNSGRSFRCMCTFDIHVARVFEKHWMKVKVKWVM